MPTTRRVSSAMIAKMTALAESAMNSEKGIKIRFASYAEAKSLRQQIYTVRKVIQKLNQSDTSAVSTVEMKIIEEGEGYTLRVREQGGDLEELKIFDLESGERMEVKADFEKYASIYAEGVVLEGEDLLDQMLSESRKGK